jgi:hypothetical protein
MHILTLIIAPVEVVLWSHHLLEPWVYFALQLVKGLYWTIFVPFGMRAVILSTLELGYKIPILITFPGIM